MDLGCLTPSELPHNSIKPPILSFCGALTECPRNGRKRCSYARSNSWKSLIYHLMSPRGIPRHSVHWSWGRLKLWLIAFNFARFMASQVPIIFFAENHTMGYDTTYSASRMLGTIWISPKCYQTTHLWFCGAPTKWPRNGRKSCSYTRSKSWKSLIYNTKPLEASHDIRCTGPVDV